MNRWQLNQVFAVFLALLFGFMFITSIGSGQDKNTTLASLFWVIVSIALFFWARRKDKEVKNKYHSDKDEV